MCGVCVFTNTHTNTQREDAEGSLVTQRQRVRACNTANFSLSSLLDRVRASPSAAYEVECVLYR
jgi:hypothetical protein